MEKSGKLSLINLLNIIIKWFLAILMMIITFLTFYQVVLRYVFNNAPSWSEELVRFLFIWCSFVGAAIGIKEHIHIGVDVFVNLLPRRLTHLVAVFVNVGIIIFSVYMIFYGWEVTIMTHGQPSPAMGIPMSWIYISIPVMGFMLLIYCSIEIIKEWKKFIPGRGDLI